MAVSISIILHSREYCLEGHTLFFLKERYLRSVIVQVWIMLLVSHYVQVEMSVLRSYNWCGHRDILELDYISGAVTLVVLLTGWLGRLYHNWAGTAWEYPKKKTRLTIIKEEHIRSLIQEKVCCYHLIQVHMEEMFVCSLFMLTLTVLYLFVHSTM